MDIFLYVETSSGRSSTTVGCTGQGGSREAEISLLRVSTYVCDRPTCEGQVNLSQPVQTHLVRFLFFHSASSREEGFRRRDHEKTAWQES